jgi:hypothetical protein
MPSIYCPGNFHHMCFNSSLPLTLLTMYLLLFHCFPENLPASMSSFHLCTLLAIYWTCPFYPSSYSPDIETIILSFFQYIPGIFLLLYWQCFQFYSFRVCTSLTTNSSTILRCLSPRRNYSLSSAYAFSCLRTFNIKA